MATLVYSAIMSLDGYIADTDGQFDWAEPDEEVHSFINHLEEGIGTHLLGRGMYEVMTAWEKDEMVEGMPAYLKEFAALWRGADKLVFSRSLTESSTKRTELRREFDPHAMRELKAAAKRDISVGSRGWRRRRSRRASSMNAASSSLPSSWAAENTPCRGN